MQTYPMVKVIYIAKHPFTNKVQEFEVGVRCITSPNGVLESVKLRAHEQLSLAKFWGIADFQYLPNIIYVEKIENGVAICRHDTTRVYRNRGRKRKVRE